MILFADAQADLGIRCPHMSEDTFSHGAAPILHNIFLQTLHVPLSGPMQYVLKIRSYVLQSNFEARTSLGP